MLKKDFVFYFILALFLTTLSFVSCGDSGGSTIVNSITSVDTDGDGESDGVLIDANVDGIYEGIDTDGNGLADIIFADSEDNNNVNAPDSPAGITVTVSSGQVILSWSTVNNTLSYNVYWSNSPGVTKENGHKIGGVPSQFTHNGLTNGTTYYYVVTAVNTAGESAVSAEVSGNPVAPESPSSGITSPSGISAVSGLNQVSLSWTAVTGASYYNIYWGYSSGVTLSTGNKIAGITGTSYSHLNLANGASYFYVVTAVVGSDESIASVQAGARPQVSAPGNIQSTSGDASVTLSWNSVSGVSSYSIYWSLSPEISANSNRISNITSGYTHSGLTNGLTYYYAVVANNAGGESVLSSVITAIPQLPATVATAVYGHDGEFTLNSVNNLEVSRYTLSNPSCVVPDGAGGIYVADYSNNRVLHYSSGAINSDRIYGQLGSSVTKDDNKGGVSADSLSQPSAVAIDAGGVYIADTNNNRVLYYSGTSTTASRVYGQGGSFASNTANSGGITANSLSSPYGIAADSTGVYISDTGNHRVLYFPGTSTTASLVYGQSSFTSANPNKGLGAPTDTTLSSPYGVAVDTNGLYIADSSNNRVLYFAGASDTTADRVYGQSGSYTTIVFLTRSADSLYFPRGVALDSGGVYIADTNNHRVLYYSGTADTTADRVYGQSGSYSTYVNTTKSADSLYSPRGIAVDASGIYIADYSNNPVLYYSGVSTTATVALGQIESDLSIFNTVIANSNGVSKDSLYYCSDVAIDSAGGTYIADTNNNRVLYFPSGSTTAARVYGQKGSFTSNDANKGGISAETLNAPNSVAVNDSGVYIADTVNNRVLYFAGTSTIATRVYGQLGGMTLSTANNGGRITGLSYPGSVTLSSSGLYITDSYNSRVLYYDGVSTTASRVYGQGNDFTTGTVNKNGLSSASLYLQSLGTYCGDVAVSTDGIYIADWNNNRVLFYEGVSTIATRVYGQYNFTASSANYGGIHAESLSNPYNVAVDLSGNLYVTDSQNNRILYYPANSTHATRVYGQSGSFATGGSNTGGISRTSLYSPRGICINETGTLYVADYQNNRVLKY